MADRAHNYTARLTRPYHYDGEEREALAVTAYEHLGSMYLFELTDGNSRSLGTGLVDEIVPTDE